MKRFLMVLFYYALGVFDSIEDSVSPEEIFQSDIGVQMKIGISETGYRTVKLNCISNSMLIQLEVDDGFEGVVYTRGSFHEKRYPCFINPKTNENVIKMRIPLDDCNTKRRGENKYSNVVILQHDSELIMPGDAAFKIECDFTNLQTTENLQKDVNVTSRITLTDADPHNENEENELPTVQNHTNTVTLSQDFLNRRREEL